MRTRQALCWRARARASMCKIVFLIRTRDGASLIRGFLIAQAFEHLQLRCKSELVRVTWYANLVTLNETLTTAFAHAPRPHAVYFVKELWGPEPDLVHLVGAYTLFDVIDNDKRSRIYPDSRTDLHDRRKAVVVGSITPNKMVDMYLVNTLNHADYLRARGVRAAPFGHPHANLEAVAGAHDWASLGAAEDKRGYDDTRLGMMASRP